MPCNEIWGGKVADSRFSFDLGPAELGVLVPLRLDLKLLKPFLLHPRQLATAWHSFAKIVHGPRVYRTFVPG